MPVGSPGVPGLTSPRALRSRVLQALSASEDVRWVLRENLDFHLRNRALRVLLEQVVHLRSPSIVVFRVLFRLHRGYEVLKPRICIYGTRCTRAPYGVAPEP